MKDKLPIDLKMAWRNIWRNFRRTLITISAIGFACVLLVFMLSFQLGGYETMINSSVKIHSGHLEVQAKGYNDKQNIRLAIPDPEIIGKICSKLKDIVSFTFRARAFSMVSSGKKTYGAMVIGIDPLRESLVSTLEKSIRSGSYLKENDKNQAIVGSLLAKNLKISIGDDLTVLGQGKDGSIAAAVLHVKGIYNSGMDEFDRSTIHIPLNTFQNIYSMGNSVHEVVMIADSLKHINVIKRELIRNFRNHNIKGLAVLSWDQLLPGLRQGIEMDLISGIIFYILLIVIVAFSILNTFFMAVFERTREFGVLMAIGTTPGRLVRLVLTESFLMTVVGIGCGMVMGIIITLFFQFHGIDLGGSSAMLRHYGISGKLYPRLSFISLLSGPCVLFFITLLTSFYPAMKIRRLTPVKAMTYV